MRVLSIAASGMSAQQTNVEVIANNIANSNTTGFKKSRAEFSDLLYQVEKGSAVPSAGGETLIPEGAELGMGVKLMAIRNVIKQGPISQTSNQLHQRLRGRRDSARRVEGLRCRPLRTGRQLQRGR